MPVRTPLTHFLALPLYNSSSVAALTTSISDFVKETTSSSTEAELDVVGDADDPNLCLSNDGDTGDGAQHEASSNALYHAASTGVASLGLKSRLKLPPAAIRPPSTLHLTIGVMSLPTSEDVDLATSMLKSMDLRDLVCSLDSSSTGPSEVNTSSTLQSATGTTTPVGGTFHPIQVHLKGLFPMQDASATTVLYAAPQDNTGRLLQLCTALKNRFTDWRLLLDDKRDLKLHATIVNTIYAKQPNRGKKGDKERLKIDARELIERWKDHVWAQVELEKVVICEMGAKEDDEGVLRYYEVAETPLF